VLSGKRNRWSFINHINRFRFRLRKIDLRKAQFQSSFSLTSFTFQKTILMVNFFLTLDASVWSESNRLQIYRADKLGRSSAFAILYLPWTPLFVDLVGLDLPKRDWWCAVLITAALYTRWPEPPSCGPPPYGLRARLWKFVDGRPHLNLAGTCDGAPSLPIHIRISQTWSNLA